MKLKKLRPIKNIKKEIWKYFSEWVRRSAKGVCFTCGTKKRWKKMNAGHYIHNALDYEPMNVHCQCVRCNKWLSGNLGIYGEKLIKQHGTDAIDALRFKAKQIWKPSRQELGELLGHWKSEVSRLNIEEPK